MMAKSLLSLCFGWVPALCAGSMDIHTAAPVQTDSYCARGYPICYYTLECLHGYSLECKSLRCDASEKVCEDFGGNFKASDWNGMCGTWEEVEDRYECCHCIGSMPMPQTVAPSTSFHRCYDSGGQCPDSFSGSCCYTRLTCPSGYSLSEPLGICGETECGIENYEASELNYMASDCNGVFPGDRVLCQTCVKDEGEMTTTTTLVTTQAPLTLVMTTVTTTPGISATSDYTAPNRSAEECDGHCSYPLSCPNGYHLKCHNIPCSDAKEGTLCNDLGEFYQVKSWSNCSAGDVNRYECCRCARQRPSTAEWELVGTLENGACRGRTPTDNSPSYYSVHHGVNDIEECKGLCLEQFPSCKGIEYSRGRCEIWTRPEGLFLSADVNVSGFTCMRFGWATQHLVPVDGGSDRACRATTSTDNQPSYYKVEHTTILEDCKARCAAAPLCYGIEFSHGRCEIWVQPIRASTQRSGFKCFAYDPAAIPVFTEKNILLP